VTVFRFSKKRCFGPQINKFKLVLNNQFTEPVFLKPVFVLAKQHTILKMQKNNIPELAGFHYKTDQILFGFKKRRFGFFNFFSVLNRIGRISNKL